MGEISKRFTPGAIAKGVRPELMGACLGSSSVCNHLDSKKGRMKI